MMVRSPRHFQRYLMIEAEKHPPIPCNNPVCRKYIADVEDELCPACQREALLDHLDQSLREDRS